MSLAKNVPKGYECIATGASVFVGKGKVIVTGSPPDEPEDAHDCDEMGCGWDHVLYRASLSDESELTYARAFLTPIAGPWRDEGSGRWSRVEGTARVARVWPWGDCYRRYAVRPGQSSIVGRDILDATSLDEAKGAADAALRASGWFLREE